MKERSVNKIKDTVEVSFYFAEKLDASHNTAGMESKTIDPRGKLRLKSVMLNITSNNIFAVASGAMAKANLTWDASLDALAINSPVGTLS